MSLPVAPDTGMLMGGENATILSKADCVGCPVPRAEYGFAVVRLVQWAVETKVLELQVGPIRQQTWPCDSQSSIAREMR